MPRESLAARAELDEIAAALDRSVEVLLAKARAAANPAEHPACRRGCAFCCHQLVPLTTIEAQRIATYLETFPRDQRRSIGAAVDRQARRFAAWVATRKPSDIQSRATNLDYLRQRIPCPFLGSQSECRIYPVRPLICRGHHALGSSASCKTGETPFRSIPALDRATKDAVAEAGRLTTLLGLPTSGGLISTFGPLFKAALKGKSGK